MWMSSNTILSKFSFQKPSTLCILECYSITRNEFSVLFESFIHFIYISLWIFDLVTSKAKLHFRYSLNAAIVIVIYINYIFFQEKTTIMLYFKDKIETFSCLSPSNYYKVSSTTINHKIFKKYFVLIFKTVTRETHNKQY